MHVTYYANHFRSESLLSRRAQTLLSATVLGTFAALILIATVMNGALP